MKIKYTYITETGFVRASNQDSIFCASNSQMGLFAVADGAGGHSNGEIASGFIVERLDEFWKIICNDKISFENACQGIKNLLFNVNSEIFTNYSSGNDICCTTVALLFLFDGRWMILNCGDSRIYSLHGLRINKETVDQTYQTFFHCDSSDPRASKLLSAVGSEQYCDFFVKTGRCAKRTSYLICSDGLYRFIDERKIRNLMFCHNDNKVLNTMKEFVYKSNAPDNFSGIIIRI